MTPKQVGCRSAPEGFLEGEWPGDECGGLPWIACEGPIRAVMTLGPHRREWPLLGGSTAQGPQNQGNGKIGGFYSSYNFPYFSNFS